MNDIKKIIVTTAELADLLDVVPKYISQMINDLGYPKAIGHNAHNLYEFLKYHFSYQERKCDERVEKIRKEKPLDRKIAAEANLKELELEERNGNLIKKDQVESLYLQTQTILISSFDGMLVKIGPQLLGINDIQTMQNKLKELGNEHKKQISDLLIKAGKLAEPENRNE